jgi:hypothetical protein
MTSYIISCLSKINFLPPSRRGHREEAFLFGGEIPPNKKPSVPFRTRFLIGAIAIKRFRSQSRREEAFDPTPRFAGLDQKKIFLCDLRASAVNLSSLKQCYSLWTAMIMLSKIIGEEAIEWKK